MTTKVMQHPWLWKRFAKGNETDYVPAEGELVISAPEINSADLRLGDGVTAKGNKISVGNFLYGPIKPALLSPVAGTQTTPHPQLTANTYAWILSDGSKAPHLSTDWQLARDSEFTDLIFESLEDTQNLTTIDLYAMGVEMTGGETYYVRLRYRSSEGTSPWCDTVQLSVQVPLADLPVASFSIPDASTSENYGVAVTISGNGRTALVGASAYGNNNGKVYFYEKDENDNWQYVKGVEASNRSASSFFGASLALTEDGTRAFIGQRRDDSEGSNVGAVYVFTKTAGIWAETDILFPTGARNGANFGSDIAASSDGLHVAIGAFIDTNGSVGDAEGALYVFKWDEATGAYTQRARLLDPDGVPTDRLGNKVVISDDGKTAAAATLKVGDGNYVTIFTEDDSGVWSLTGRMLPPDISPSSRFGYAISLSSDGDRLAVTNYDLRVDSNVAGGVYIYNKDENGSWSPTHLITGDYPGGQYELGQDVKLTKDGNTLMVLDDMYGDGGTRDVYIYQPNSSGVWVVVSTLSLPALDYNSYFHAMDISSNGSDVIAGEYRWENNIGTAAGQVHLFS